LSEPSITASRAELKYQIDGTRVADFLGGVLKHLRPHRFRGEGVSTLPDAHHYSTTIYFDTPSRALLEASRRDFCRNYKIRVREYYDLHSSLTELATDPTQIVRYQPWLWFELKRRHGDHTTKHRLRLPKAEVPGFFRGASSLAPTSVDERADLAAIQAAMDELGEPLEASVLVNYRRLAFQDATETLRVTLDLELAFYAPPEDLWTRERALVRGTFGTPRERARNGVLEIKHRGPLPAWLSDALARAQVEPEQSGKFLRAGRAVYDG
jgi:hypothetical protein